MKFVSFFWSEDRSKKALSGAKKEKQMYRTGISAVALAVFSFAVLIPSGSSLARDRDQDSGNELTAQLLDRVSNLESQVREMRGELDELTNRQKEQNDLLNKKIDDQAFAAQNGQGGGGSAKAAATASVGAGAGAAAAAAPKKTASDHLKAGTEALLQRNYAGAQEEAEAALAGAKGSATKVDATFLKAQSLAGQKAFKQSALTYFDAYRISPKGARAPDALLGVSATLLALGDKKAACQALGKLKAEFPSPAPRIANAAEKFRSRGGC